MRRSVPSFVVDAFSIKPYRGNPAAICYLCRHDVVHDDILQAIAAEMNLSETAFLFPLSDEQNSAVGLAGGNGTAVANSATTAKDSAEGATFNIGIRWFTPEREVGLCGHATLAAAHTLFTEPVAKDIFSFVPAKFASVTFYGVGAPAKNVKLVVTTRSDPEPAATAGSDAAVCGRSNDFVPAKKGSYDMEFPMRPPNPTTVPPASLKALQNALGVLDSDIEEILLDPVGRKYLVVLKNASIIPDLNVDIQMLHRQFLPPVPPLSVTVTALAHAGAQTVHGPHDVVSRHFAPWVGIPEDPVTGAAHIVIAPYWFAKHPGRFRVALNCYQASKRGGFMKVTKVPGRTDVVSLFGGASTMLAGHHFACVNYRKTAAKL